MDKTLPNFKPLIRSIVISIVLPAIATTLLTHAGMPLGRATLLSAVFPVAEMWVAWRETRTLDAIAIVSLVLLAASFATSSANGDPRIMFVKDSALTLAGGLVFLGSLLLPRPLIFYVSRSYMAGSSAELWEDRWQSMPQFRTTMRTLTAVWGSGLVLDAIARLSLLPKVPPATIVVVSPIIAIVTFTALIIWTRSYVRAVRARAGAMSASAETGSPGALERPFERLRFP